MKCPVCGKDTFDEIDHDYEICPECYWEYDSIQVDAPDFSGGANSHSLNEYRRIYRHLIEINPRFSCRNKSDRELIIALVHETDLSVEDMINMYIIRDRSVEK